MKIETDLDGAVVGAIERHYKHAKEKHPYFCDIICRDKTQFDGASFLLDDYRQRIKCSIDSKVLCWSDLLGCEMYEALVEIGNGKTAAAVEECYDAIAVLLRVVDVLQGRQALGRPKESEVAR